MPRLSTHVPTMTPASLTPTTRVAISPLTWIVLNLKVTLGVSAARANRLTVRLITARRITKANAFITPRQTIGIDPAPRTPCKDALEAADPRNQANKL